MIRTQVVAMVVDALMKAEISNGGIKGSRTGAWSRMGPRHNSNHAGSVYEPATGQISLPLSLSSHQCKCGLGRVQRLAQLVIGSRVG